MHQFESESSSDSWCFPRILLPFMIVLSFILSFGFQITPAWFSLAANSQVKNSSPLNPSKPSNLSFMIPSMKKQRVGRERMLSFCTKKGAFSAWMERNCVLGNCWERILRCLCMMVHLWNSLWKKWTTVNLSLVTQLRNSSYVICIQQDAYLSVLADSAGLLMMTSGHFLIHPKPLFLHLPHDFLGLLVLKLIQFIIILQPLPLSLLGLPLLLLLHDNLVTDHLLHDDIVEDVAQQFVLHLIQIKQFQIDWVMRG